MTSKNMPILYQNIMYGLPSDFARDAFLWATDQSGNDKKCYSAEKFAREADALVKTLTPMLNASAQLHNRDKHDPDLMDYILKRHANKRYDNNKSPTYAA